MIVDIDIEADAAYVELGDGQAATTVEIADGVLVDLDDLGVVIGLELLGLRRPIPIDRVLADCHVAADQELGLRSLMAAIEMAGGSDLVSVTTIVGHAGSLVAR